MTTELAARYCQLGVASWAPNVWEAKRQAAKAEEVKAKAIKNKAAQEAWAKLKAEAQRRRRHRLRPKPGDDLVLSSSDDIQ